MQISSLQRKLSLDVVYVEALNNYLAFGYNVGHLSRDLGWALVLIPLTQDWCVHLGSSCLSDKKSLQQPRASGEAVFGVKFSLLKFTFTFTLQHNFGRVVVGKA